MMQPSPASPDNEAIRGIRDSSLRLEKSSKRLEKLTIALTVLTVILAISTIYDIFLRV